MNNQKKKLFVGMIKDPIQTLGKTNLKHNLQYDSSIPGLRVNPRLSWTDKSSTSLSISCQKQYNANVYNTILRSLYNGSRIALNVAPSLFIHIYHYLQPYLLFCSSLLLLLSLMFLLSTSAPELFPLFGRLLFDVLCTSLSRMLTSIDLRFLTSTK